MTEEENRLAVAREEALARRDRLRDQLQATRERLNPVRLRDDVVTFARDSANALRHETVAHIRQHPVRTAVGLAALAGWIARKPLLAHAPPLVASIYGWLSGQLRLSHSGEEAVADGAICDSPVGESDEGDETAVECDNDNERTLP